MRLFANFKNEYNPNYNEVELFYSYLNYPHWYCRIWSKDWLTKIKCGQKECGESHGKTKFEAYRKALNDLNN